jgi:hypothetical protein
MDGPYVPRAILLAKSFSTVDALHSSVTVDSEKAFRAVTPLSHSRNLSYILVTIPETLLKSANATSSETVSSGVLSKNFSHDVNTMPVNKKDNTHNT